MQRRALCISAESEGLLLMLRKVLVMSGAVVALTGAFVYRGGVRFIQADGTYVAVHPCEPIPEGIRVEPAADDSLALFASYTGIAPPEGPIAVPVETDSGLQTRFFVQVVVPGRR